MLICDTHADTLFRRVREQGTPCDITKESLEKGGVSLQVLALYVGGSPKLCDIRPLYDEMILENERLHAEGWQQVADPRDAQDGECRYMLSVEGCDLLDGRPELLGEWRKLGVRLAALTWNHPNCVATPASVDACTGLTPFGREAVREMVRLRIAPDVSHLNERGFYDLLEMGVVPLASHSCCRKLCDHPRNLTDDQLRALFDAGGYVGVNFYPRFLRKNGQADRKDVCCHILHLLEMGGEGKIGFGSDFDGIEVKPAGLSGPQDLPALLDGLRAAGLSEETVRGIAGENFLRYFDRIDPRQAGKG